MRNPPIQAAFQLEGTTLRLDKLLPTRAITDKLKASVKYRAVLASVAEVGLVEPLSVFPQKGGKYLLLDGHLRVKDSQQERESFGFPWPPSFWGNRSPIDPAEPSPSL